MEFLSRIHDKLYPRYVRYLIVGASGGENAWHRSRWREIYPSIEELAAGLGQKPSIRSRQIMRGRSAAAPLGRLPWSNEGHQRWCHGSPLTADRCDDQKLLLAVRRPEASQEPGSVRAFVESVQTPMGALLTLTQTRRVVSLNQLESILLEDFTYLGMPEDPLSVLEETRGRWELESLIGRDVEHATLQHRVLPGFSVFSQTWEGPPPELLPAVGVEGDFREDCTIEDQAFTFEGHAGGGRVICSIWKADQIVAHVAVVSGAEPEEDDALLALFLKSTLDSPVVQELTSGTARPFERILRCRERPLCATVLMPLESRAENEMVLAWQQRWVASHLSAVVTYKQ